MLQQVPLIKNPKFQPPRPITLDTNYAKLIPSLPHTVYPPKLNMTAEDIDKWIGELEMFYQARLDRNVLDGKRLVFYDWLALVKRKVAPGYSFDVMTPVTRETQEKQPAEPEVEKEKSVRSELSDLSFN